MFLVTPPADQGSKRPLLKGKEKSNEINSAVEIYITCWCYHVTVFHAKDKY